MQRSGLCKDRIVIEPLYIPGVLKATFQKSCKGTLLGTPNREPQEYSRNIMEYKDPGWYIPIIYLLYSWGSLFGVPSRVPLSWGRWTHTHLRVARLKVCELGFGFGI